MKWKKIQFYIPYEMGFDAFVSAMNFNGCIVDDLGSATKDGQVVDIWIPEKSLDNANPKEHVGYFYGRQVSDIDGSNS